MDRRHKLVRRYQVSDAATHDSKVLDDILDGDNTALGVWADSAYRSAEIEAALKKKGLRSPSQSPPQQPPSREARQQDPSLGRSGPRPVLRTVDESDGTATFTVTLGARETPGNPAHGRRRPQRLTNRSSGKSRILRGALHVDAKRPERRVDYATGDGTATAGADYTAANGTLTFAPGETTKPISITIADDTVDEDGETFW